MADQRLPIYIWVTARCQTCDRAVSVEGGPSTNTADILRIVRSKYGWAGNSKGLRCFDDRKRPIKFHALDCETVMGSSGRCRVCNAWDNRDEPHEPQHCEEAVRENATELREQRYAHWE